MGRSWDKFLLLLWKNWLLQRRQRKQTIIEIIVPVFFTLLLVVIRALVEVTNVTEPSIYEPFNPLHLPQHNFGINNGNNITLGNNTILPDETQDAICEYITTGEPIKEPDLPTTPSPYNIFSQQQFRDNSWNKLLRRVPQARNIFLQQWILVYSPNPPFLKKFMRDAEEVIPFIECGVASASDLENLLSVPGFGIQRMNLVLAGIVFDDKFANMTSLPTNVNVTIRFPGERRVEDLNTTLEVENQGGSTTRNWYTNLLFPLFQLPGPRNLDESDGGSPGYYKEGFLAVQTAISKTVLQYHNIDSELVPEIQLQRFPYPSYLDDKLLLAMQSMLPLIIMLSFVYSAISTVRTIATEKEKQLKEAMKMMGLPSWLHWLAWFTKTLLFLLISVVLIVILLKAPIAGAGKYVLAASDWSCILAFLFTYIVASITFCFALSSFFSTASTGAIVSGLIWFLFFLPYMLLQPNYNDTSLSTKLAVSLFSNTAMAYGFQVVLMYEGTGAGLQWSNLWTPVTPTDTLTMGHVMGMLLVDAAIYMLITIYVEGVYPGEFGVPLPWYFPFTRSYWLGEPIVNDSGAAQEESTAVAGTFEREPKNLHAGVCIKHLRKVYRNGKVAVHDLSLNLYEGQITVLLGHNGAGKTTTMSMLTGTATISGHDIRTDMDGARETLGLCPQYNILFDELSVKEHLNFFGKLKGLKAKALEAETNRFIQILNLEDKRNAPSKSLSGGMKRKLAAAVALCGGSKVVLFDEPTSGMDPAARRALWDLLQAEKTGRTVLLTTHFMDEADVLGDRIAIMSEGRLRAAGSSFFLKKTFGGGYHLIMVKNEHCKPYNVTALLSQFVPGISPSADIGAELSYHLDDEYQHKFQIMFTELEENKRELGISSYGVSLTTMEEVFMKVGSEEEVAKDESEGISTIDLLATTSNGHANNGSQVSLTFKREPLLKNPKLFYNQVWAMFLKYVLSTYRSWILYVIVVAFPVVDLVVAYLVGQTYSGTNDLPARFLTIQDYHGGIVTVAAMTGSDASLISTYNSLIRQDEGSIRNLNDMNLDLNISKYILEEANRDVGQVSQKYILGTYFEESNITAMFNNQPYHTPPLALGYVYNAILKTYGSHDYSLTFVNHPLPYTAQTKVLLQQQGGNKGFQIAFNMGFSFAFIVSYFIVFFIRERVTKAKHLQFVSGVNVPTFWVTGYIWNLLASLGPLIAIILTFVAFQEEGFRSTDELGRIFLVMISCVFASLPVAYLASYLFDVPASGFSRLIMVHIFTGVAAFLVVQVLSTPSLDLQDVSKTLDWVFTFLPTYSLTYSMYSMNTNYLYLKICQPLSFVCETNPNICCRETDNCGADECVKFTNDFLSWDQPGIGRNIFIFFLDGLVLFGILMLIEHRVWEMLSYKSRVKDADTTSNTKDSDVLEENTRIAKLSQDDRKEYNLMLQNVTKFYGSFRAVHNLNLGVKKGECFGLLGVNGAGKTTTFKMMTGDEMITMGDAFVKGLSLKYQMKQVYRLIGYCPQFDALLDDLTGRETLKIFCLLRGVPNYEVDIVSEKLAKELLFFKHIDKKVKEYSGGNKRKLSTAVALVGDPPVIYLDEPTTGMDPVAKRHLWNVICRVRDAGKTIILTSHSMEECEALCTRLAIMVNGEFLCLGSPQHLKNKFAEGYTLIIKARRSGVSSPLRPTSINSAASRPSLKRLDSSLSEHDLESIKKYVQRNFPAATLREEYLGLLTYQIPQGDLSWASMFGIMEDAKATLDIEDYSLGQTSLEQVFLSFTKFQEKRNEEE